MGYLWRRVIDELRLDQLVGPPRCIPFRIAPRAADWAIRLFCMDRHGGQSQRILSTAHRPRGRPCAQRRSPQPVLHRGPPEPPGVPPTRCHIAPWSARLVGAIVRAFTFEDRQCRPRARHRVAGDLPEFGPAEFDRRGVIRHVVILLHRGPNSQRGPDQPGCGYQRRSVPTVFSAERCGFHETAGGAPV